MKLGPSREIWALRSHSLKMVGNKSNFFEVPPGRHSLFYQPRLASLFLRRDFLLLRSTISISWGRGG